MEDNNALYRGLAKDISGAKNMDEILKMTGMDFEVEKVPATYKFGDQVKNMEGHFAVVRTDTGQSIAPNGCSGRFNIHPNREIVEGLAGLAELGEIKTSHGGILNNGEHVFLHGSVDKTFDVFGETTTMTKAVRKIRGESVKKGGGYTEANKAVEDAGIKKGDIVRLDFSLSGSHSPGHPTIIKAVPMVLWCLNGATSSGDAVGVRVPHYVKFQKRDTEKVLAYIEKMTVEFETFEQKARRLLGYKMGREETQAYVIELLQPQLLKLAAERPISNIQRAAPVNMTGRELLDALMSREDRMLDKIIGGDIKDPAYKLDRTTKQVLQAVDTNPHAKVAPDTAWNAYNAVTFHVDHVAGRDSSAAVRSALVGPGANLKARALDLAIEYTQRNMVTAA